MISDEKLMEMLSSDKYHPPYEAITEMRQQERISDKVLLHILALDDKFLIGDFLEIFEYFNSDQIKIVEEYIRMHLNDRDKLFVAKLIECANFDRIMSFYDDCLEFVRSKRNEIVVNAALDYVFENMQFHRIKEIVRTFRRVINNKSYGQRSQVVASLYLFRITLDDEYFAFLEELVVTMASHNAIVLKNSLNDMDYNHKKYFSYYDKLMALVLQREEMGKK